MSGRSERHRWGVTVIVPFASDLYVWPMRLRLAFALAVTLCPFSARGQPVPTVEAVAPASENNAPSVRVRQVYRVKQQGGGLGVFVDEAAVFHEVGEGRSRVWIVERRRRDERLGAVTLRYEWIDGRTCAALERLIAALSQLPPSSMAGLETEPQGWVSDVPEVTLVGPPAGGRHGDLLVRRDLMGPVSSWWRGGEKTLEGCWQSKKPYIPGAYDLRPRLATAQDEVEVMRPY